MFSVSILTLSLSSILSSHAEGLAEDCSGKSLFREVFSISWESFSKIIAYAFLISLILLGIVVLCSVICFVAVKILQSSEAKPEKGILVGQDLPVSGINIQKTPK